uniref:Uncharacterized protein n=1 Tax=Oryza sativa subsp. japonica TaxID=39947 RepID=Q69MX7_ORYSJ|nr:hypothetical protein [Oryza sativa Japonica Group]BAD36298.1 hypothetical protein [Oryza sativa Japonica Group]
MVSVNQYCGKRLIRPFNRRRFEHSEQIPTIRNQIRHRRSLPLSPPPPPPLLPAAAAAPHRHSGQGEEKGRGREIREREGGRRKKGRREKGREGREEEEDVHA